MDTRGRLGYVWVAHIMQLTKTVIVIGFTTSLYYDLLSTTMPRSSASPPPNRLPDHPQTGNLNVSVERCCRPPCALPRIIERGFPVTIGAFGIVLLVTASTATSS